MLPGLSLSPPPFPSSPGSSSRCRKVATRVNSPSVSALPLKIPYHTASFHFRNIRVLSATKGTSRLNNQWIARPHAFGRLPHPVLVFIHSYFTILYKPSLSLWFFSLLLFSCIFIFCFYSYLLHSLFFCFPFFFLTSFFHYIFLPLIFALFSSFNFFLILFLNIFSIFYCRSFFFLCFPFSLSLFLLPFFFFLYICFAILSYFAPFQVFFRFFRSILSFGTILFLDKTLFPTKSYQFFLTFEPFTLSFSYHSVHNLFIYWFTGFILSPHALSVFIYLP